MFSTSNKFWQIVIAISLVARAASAVDFGAFDWVEKHPKFRSLADKYDGSQFVLLTPKSGQKSIVLLTESKSGVEADMIFESPTDRVVPVIFRGSVELPKLSALALLDVQPQPIRPVIDRDKLTDPAHNSVRQLVKLQGEIADDCQRVYVCDEGQIFVNEMSPGKLAERMNCVRARLVPFDGSAARTIDVLPLNDSGLDQSNGANQLFRLAKQVPATMTKLAAFGFDERLELLIFADQNHCYMKNAATDRKIEFTPLAETQKRIDAFGSRLRPSHTEKTLSSISSEDLATLRALTCLDRRTLANRWLHHPRFYCLPFDK